MKIKVSDASPIQLDYMVAVLIHGSKKVSMGKGHHNPKLSKIITQVFINPNKNSLYWYNPSESWAQGGPIIEQEIPKLLKTHGGDWIAQGRYNYAEDREAPRYYGPTPLIAAMRCYVASKLGEEVEIPDDFRYNIENYGDQ